LVKDPVLNKYLHDNKDDPEFPEKYSAVSGFVTDLEKFKNYPGVQLRSNIKSEESEWIVTANIKNSILVDLSKEKWVKSIQGPRPIYPIKTY
jgi:hypothetical protein